MSPASRIKSYSDVKAEILRRIAAKVWAVGDPIPNEEDLAREFQCARTTVNRALRELAEAGIVERKRRAGTRVAEAPAQDMRFKIPLVEDEVAALPARYRYRCLIREALSDETIALTLKLAPDAPLLHVCALHYADDAPFQIEERWINLSAIPQAREERFEEISANAWLVREVPLSRLDTQLYASAASGELAKLLAIKAQSPILVIERTTWRSDQALTHARLSYRGDYKISASSA